MQFHLNQDGSERRLITKREQTLLGNASRLMFGISRHTSGDMHVAILEGARSLEKFLAEAEEDSTAEAPEVASVAAVTTPE